MFRTASRGGCALLALFLAAGPAFAAPPPVTGRVTDPSGTPVANARVVLTGANRSTNTDADGSFAFRSVPAGTYHLDVTFPGFAPAHVEVVVPASGADLAVDIELTPTPLALEGVIVTGAPGGSDPLSITQSATQLAGKEFDRQIATTVAETLADEPGITTRYSGPAASMPVIRGLTGERVLMLQNGQRTGDLAGSSSDHAVSVDPLSATRIEVVRGPASLLYGSSALGGVVNVIGTEIPTNIPTRLEGYVAAQGVSVTPGGAATGEVVLPLASTVAISARGGFRDMGDVRIGGGEVLASTGLTSYHLDVGLGYVGERFSGGVALSGYDFNYGIAAGLHGHAGETPEEHEGHEEHEEEGGIRLDGRRYETHLEGEVTTGSETLGRVEANGSLQWYEHDEIEPDGVVGTNFRLNTQTLDVRARTDVGFARGTIGVSGLSNQYEPSGEEALTPPATSTAGGAFVYQEIPLGAAHEDDAHHVPQLQVGARYDLYRVDAEASDEFASAGARSFGAVSGSVGISVPVGEYVAVGGSVARAFRAPSVEELFSSGFHAAVGSFDIGNPGLEPETNLGGEALVRIQSARVDGLVSAYYNRIDDFIAPHLVGDTTIAGEEGAATVPLNVYRQGDATLRGVEGKIELVTLPSLVLGLRGDLVRGRYTDGSPLPYMPSGHLGGEVRWDDGGFGLGADVQHAFAQGEVPENEFAVSAYTLFGLNASFTRTMAGRAHSVTLRADNLLDEAYREATSRIKEIAPNPGRNLSVVYRVLF